VPELLVTRDTQPVKLLGFKEAMIAKRLNKLLDFFATDQASAVIAREGFLEIEFGAGSVDEKSESRNPNGGDEEDGLCVTERIPQNQSRRLLEWRRHDVDAVAEWRNVFAHAKTLTREARLRGCQFCKQSPSSGPSGEAPGWCWSRNTVGFYSNVRDSFDDLAFLDIPLHFAVVPGTLNFPRIADIRKMASPM
jgi:hypothetical protein